MAAEMPDIEVGHVVSPHSEPELGAKGAGEEGTGGAPGAIMKGHQRCARPFECRRNRAARDAGAHPARSRQGGKALHEHRLLRRCCSGGKEHDQDIRNRVFGDDPRPNPAKVLWSAAITAGAMTVAGATTGSWSKLASAQEPIRIGFSMALTGALAGAGKPALIAMEIWREDINAKGGLLGRPVEFVYYDDQTAPANVPKIYTKLLNVDKVDLVVSGYGTNAIAPAMPVIMREKLVFMTLFGLGANEEYNYDRYFQIMPAGPQPRVDWSRGFFQLAKENQLGTIALVGADAEYPKNALGGARVNAKDSGLQIVYDESYPPSTTDFTPIIRAIQATNPDVVFVASYPPDSAGIVRAANELDLQTKLFGGGMVGLQFASLQTSLGPMLNGIVNYDFWVPEPTLDFPGIQDVLARYQARAEGQGDRFARPLPDAVRLRLCADPGRCDQRCRQPRSAGAREVHPRDHLRFRGRAGQVRARMANGRPRAC